MYPKNNISTLHPPIIGISATLLTIESGNFIGLDRCAVVQDYVNAIVKAGGIPIVLPVVEEEDCIAQQVQLIDGLLLSGGYDVSPLFYGEEPKRGLESIRPERDAYEIRLLQIARELNKPILGICRGIQVLNVAFGGNLYQDLSLEVPSSIQHSQKGSPDQASHSVKLSSGTKIKEIMEEEFILTNSFHHQAVKDLAPGFIANAYSKDGLIEGIESIDDSFILGVQWHPELMFVKSPKMLKLFQAFVEASYSTIFFKKSLNAGL